ncbi:MAG: hypothetical protein WCT03_05435 [Candidatus Obscuribacterales bacterium]
MSAVRPILRCGALLVALLQAWAYRYSVYMEDDWSYLDIADNYLRGDFAAALSSYWSPLYSWLIALTLWLLQPVACEKFVVLKLINFASFLFVIFTFERLLDQVLAWYGADDKPEQLRVSARLIEVSSYIVFIFMSLSVGAVWKDTPDLLMSGFLYGATALTLSFWRASSSSDSGSSSSRLKEILLGVALAAGYLCKAVMIPVSLVYVLVLALAPQAAAVRKRAIVTVVAAFLLIAGPYIAAISWQQQRPLFSTTMPYNYALWVLRSAPFCHALAGRPANQLPIEFKHPSTVIFAEPQVFYFAEPIHATFSTHYDPAYWYEGVKVYFDGEQQFVASVASISVLVRLFFGWLFFGWLVLLIGCRTRALSLQSMKPRLLLFLPALAGMTVYTIGLNCNTLFAERYFPGFFVLWYLGLMGSVRLPNSNKAKQVLLASTILSLLGMGWRFTVELGNNFSALKDSGTNSDCLILTRLTEIGIKSGDQLASMDHLRKVGWAQMGHFRIVADILDDGKFWSLPAARQEALYAVLRQHQIRVLTYANGEQPPAHYPQGWQQVAGTQFWFYVL